MNSSSSLSCLGCQVRIIKARNVDFESTGNLFVRCYLSAGNNTRVRLDTKEISVKSDMVWNESFSLECSGTEDSVTTLMQGTVICELRLRRTKTSVFGRGSQLLGRAEIPWKTVCESPDMEIENWVMMVSKSRRVVEDVKPPAVLIAMKFCAPATAETAASRRRRRERLRTKHDECGCGGGGSGSGCYSYVEYDIFALGAALEVM